MSPLGTLAWGSLHWELPVMEAPKVGAVGSGVNLRVGARKRSPRELTGDGEALPFRRRR